MTATAAAVLPLPADPPEAVAAVLRSVEAARGAWTSVVDDTAGTAVLLADGWSGPAAQACQTHLAADRRRWITHVDLAADQAAHLGRYLDLLVEAQARIGLLRAEHTAVAAAGENLARRAAAGAVTRTTFDAEASAISRTLADIRGRHAVVSNEVAAQAAVTSAALLDGVPGEDPGGRPDLDRVLREYQVSPEPLQQWRVTGITGWLASIAGAQPAPASLPRTEAEMLDGLSPWQKLRFSEITDRALEAATGRYPGDGVLRDDHGDAFRHAYWNAMLVWEFGPQWAARYTSAHEAVPGTPAQREAMDLFNNEVGRSLALESPLHRDDEELQEKIARAVEEGRLVVVGADGDLHWTDRVERSETMPAERLDRHPAVPGRSIDEIAGAS